MDQQQLQATILARLHQNQVALAEALWLLAQWVGQRGSTDVAEGVRQQLQLLTNNSASINQALGELCG